MVTKYFIFTLFVLFTGCTTTPKISTVKKAQKLESILLSLHVNKEEAKDLSGKIFKYSRKLAEEYELVKPPLYHNFLVNMGIKKRGLCWQFAYDMLSFVKKQNYKSFDYYIGGANINNYWSEHNVLVVTCKGCNFEEGVLLDPWRNSGELFFCKIKNDKNYKWKQRGGIR